MNIPSHVLQRWAPAVFALLLLVACTPRAFAGLVDDWIQSFADSEIVFQRSTSNVPFLPLGYADLGFYRDTEVRRPDRSPLQFDLTTVSQGVVLPFLVGPRDALFVGEWIGLSSFDAIDSDVNSFDVVSVGLPLGWLRQVDENWQAGTFAMPLAHRADLDNSDWGYEVLGGVFGRYLQDDDLWWVFGLYYDVGAGNDIYLPYLGVSWELSDEVTMSAVLPWPAVLYSPDRDKLWRFGASPSVTSWSLNGDQDEVNYTLDTWNLGFSAERRMRGNFWVALEAGVAGLRSLRLEGGQWEGVEFDIEETAFLRIAINYRPELP